MTAAEPHELDICVCGDYRRQHTHLSGPCVFNEHGTPDGHFGAGLCQQFALATSFIKAGPLPRDVTCPLCQQIPGRCCVTGSGYPTATHLARWRIVGVVNPDASDRHRDYEDGVARDVARIVQNSKTPQWLTEARKK